MARSRLILGGGGLLLGLLVADRPSTASDSSAATLLPSLSLPVSADSTVRLPAIAANDNRRAAGTLRGSVLEVELEVREGVWRPEAEDGSNVGWRAIAKDGADLPSEQATLQPSHLLTGPGETADFEFTPNAPGDLRLEVRSPLSGWYIPVPIHVRARAPAVAEAAEESR